jgi:hypothetical protein
VSEEKSTDPKSKASSAIRGKFIERLKALRVKDPDNDLVRGEFWSDMPKIAFVLLPIFALLLKLLFRNADRFYVDHLILALQLHAFAYLLLVPPLLISSRWVTLASIACIAVYLSIAVRRFYGQGWPRTLIKLFVLAFLYLPPLALGAVATAMVAVWFA